MILGLGTIASSRGFSLELVRTWEPNVAGEKKKSRPN